MNNKNEADKLYKEYCYFRQQTENKINIKKYNLNVNKYINKIIKTKDENIILLAAESGNLSKKNLDDLTNAIIRYGYIKDQIEFLENVKGLSEKSKKDLIDTILNSKDVSYECYLCYFAREYKEIDENILNKITDRLIDSKYAYYLCNFASGVKSLSNFNIDKIIDCLIGFNLCIVDIIFCLSKCEKLTNKNIEDLTEYICLSNHGYYIYEYLVSFERYLSKKHINDLSNAIIETDDIKYIKKFSDKLMNLKDNFKEKNEKYLNKDIVSYILDNNDINLAIELFNTCDNFLTYCIITNNRCKNEAINFIQEYEKQITK